MKKEENIEKIKSIVNDGHYNIIVLKDKLEAINFIFTEPEKVGSNIELMYGVKSILKEVSIKLESISDNFDIPLDLWDMN